MAASMKGKYSIAAVQPEAGIRIISLLGLKIHAALSHLLKEGDDGVVRLRISAVLNEKERRGCIPLFSNSRRCAHYRRVRRVLFAEVDLFEDLSLRSLFVLMVSHETLRRLLGMIDREIA